MKVITLIAIVFSNLTFANSDLAIEYEVLNQIQDEKEYSGAEFKHIKDRLKELKPKPQTSTKNTLDGESTISGVVTDSDGSPISGVHMTLIENDQQLMTIETNELGEFTFDTLAAGSYKVIAGDFGDDYINQIWQSVADGGPKNCSYICNVPETSLIQVSDLENIIDIDFQLYVGGSVTGVLLDSETSAPVTTMSVQFVVPGEYNPDYQPRWEFDNETGAYRLFAIPDGDYKLFLTPYDTNLHIPQIWGGPECNNCNSFLSENGSVISISNANNIVDINFDLNVGASISGFLVDNNTLQPLQEYGLVMVFNELNYNLAYIIVYGTNLDPEANGSFTVGGLLPGSYYVQGGDLGRDFYQRELFENNPCYWSGCDRGTGDPIVLSGQENRLGVNFLLNKGGKISGNVLDTNTGLVPDFDAPVSYVQFYNSDEVVVGGAGILQDGSYTSARALPPGNYSVRTGSMFTGANTAPFVSEKYDDLPCLGLACDLTTADVNVTVDNVTSGIDFNLDTGFSFSGTITEDGSEIGIPDVYVLVYKDMGEGEEPKYATWTTTGNGVDSPAGFFEISGLPAGTYYARTNNGSNLPFAGFRTADANGWIDILYDSIACPGSCDVSMGTPIVLSAAKGGNTFDFNLAQGATISGRVVDDKFDAGILGVQVNVFNDSGVFLASYNTDSEGNFLTSGFEPGTYYLTTSSFDVLVDVKFGGDSCSGSCNPLEGVPVTLTELEAKTGIDFKLKSDFVFGQSFE